MNNRERRYEAKRILRQDHGELAAAAREWLRFDNDVEQPRDEAPYVEHVAYESRKFAITERVAAALEYAPSARRATNRGAA